MQSVKKVYLYLVSFAALIIAIIGSIMLINLALKTWVLTKADQDFYQPDYYRCTANQQAANDPKAAPITIDESKCSADELAKLKAEANDRRTAQKQRDAATAIAMVLVASPIWYIHWKWARKEV